MSSSYLLASVSRAIEVVNHLQQIHGESVSLLELARQTGIHKTTVLRVLRTLEHHGWVVQPAPGRYRAAIRFSGHRPHRIAYSSRDNRLAFPRAVTASVTRCASARGVELLAFDNRASRAQTLRNAERMVREKVDLAIVFQAESSTGPELATRFNEAGVPLISIDMAIAGAFYFGADNYQAGLTAGRAMARALLEPGGGPAPEELILVDTPRFGSLPAARLQGFVSGFQKHYPQAGGIATATLDSRGSFEVGLRLLRARMRAARRRGIAVCVSDPAALGAVQAIEETGRARDWRVWSFGGGADVRQELRRPGSPLFGAIGFAPESYGDQLWTLVAPLLANKPAAPALFARTKVLTRQNIDSVYPQDQLHPEPANEASALT